jgi:acyl-CoA thioesterase YciA
VTKKSKAAGKKGTKSKAVSPKPTLADKSRVVLPVGRMPVLRVLPMPSDANIHGDVFGGWIMAQVDIAGSLPAVKRANGRVATIAVNSFLFKQPVFVGDLLSFYADVTKVGTTSITVQVEVFAERNRLNAEIVKVTEATLTYVATDEFRKPRLLPDIAELR